MESEKALAAKKGQGEVVKLKGRRLERTLDELVTSAQYPSTLINRLFLFYLREKLLVAATDGKLINLY